MIFPFPKPQKRSFLQRLRARFKQYNHRAACILDIFKDRFRAPFGLRPPRFVSFSLISCLCAVLTFSTVPAVFSIVHAQPAEARNYLPYGPGVAWTQFPAPGAGAFIANNRLVYCVEIEVPSGDFPTDFRDTNIIPAFRKNGVSAGPISGDEYERMSYIVGRYGQTQNGVQAAAVAVSIWKIRGRNGGNEEHHSSLDRVLRVLRANGGAEVDSLSNEFLAQADQWLHSLKNPVPRPNTPVIRLDANTTQTSYTGTVEVPEGTIDIQGHNAVFQNGERVAHWPDPGAPAGTVLSWRASPPNNNWARYVPVSFSGNQVRLTTTYPLRYWSAPGSYQSLIEQPAPRQNRIVTALQTGIAHIDTAWNPQLSSTVESVYLQKGQQFSDTVTFWASHPSGHKSGVWRWRETEGQKEWMPVTARGTLYGPFLSDPALNPSQNAPLGSPEVFSVQITTDPNRDHSQPQTYSVRSPQFAREQGYYTWKWDIYGSEQHPDLFRTDMCEGHATQECSVFPREYFYTDGFGTHSETQVVQMQAKYKTLISRQKVQLRERIHDRIRLEPLDNWLRDSAGNRIPLTLTGTLYAVQEKNFVRNRVVPASARVLHRSTVRADSKMNEQTLISASVEIPVDLPPEYTHVSYVWCVVDQDQVEGGRNFWQESCDDFGIPEESAVVERPVTVTDAPKEVGRFNIARDSVRIDGFVPAGTFIRAKVYRKPEFQELRGKDPEKVWNAKDIARIGNDPYCTVDNLYAVSESETIPSRRYTKDDAPVLSAPVFFGHAGTFWWVEELVTTLRGKEVVLARGECGLASETTLVKNPQAVTQAVSRVRSGEDAWDTAVVHTRLPNPQSNVRLALSFHVFQKPEVGAVKRGEMRVVEDGAGVGGVGDVGGAGGVGGAEAGSGVSGAGGAGRAGAGGAEAGSGVSGAEVSGASSSMNPHRIFRRSVNGSNVSYTYRLGEPLDPGKAGKELSSASGVSYHGVNENITDGLDSREREGSDGVRTPGSQGSPGVQGVQSSQSSQGSQGSQGMQSAQSVQSVQGSGEGRNPSNDRARAEEGLAGANGESASVLRPAPLQRVARVSSVQDARWSAKEVETDRQQPMCVPENHVYALEETVAVGEANTVYESPRVPMLEDGSYYWVETLSYVYPDGTRELVHAGECGLAQETTLAHTPDPVPPAAPHLADTGRVFLPYAVLASLAACTFGTLTLVKARRRRGPTR